MISASAGITLRPLALCVGCVFVRELLVATFTPAASTSSMARIKLSSMSPNSSSSSLMTVGFANDPELGPADADEVAPIT